MYYFPFNTCIPLKLGYQHQAAHTTAQTIIKLNKFPSPSFHPEPASHPGEGKGQNIVDLLDFFGQEPNMCCCSENYV